MGLFGTLFGKKKQKGAQATNDGNAPHHPTPQGQTHQSKSSPSRSKSSKAAQQGSDDPDQWMYDSVLQYLTSPLWKVPIYSFIDENCIVFDDEEENKFEYTDIHNKFKKMIEEMISSLLADLTITEENFMSLVNKGFGIKEHKKVFEQLLIADNFLVFKKLMLKRNKELELEALKQLEEIGQDSGADSGVGHGEIQKLELEKEQAEIEEAIARSLAVEDEKKNLQDLEDQELQEALRVSAQEFETVQEAEKRKALEEQARQQQLADQERQKQLAEQERLQREEQERLEKQKQQEREKEEASKPQAQAQPQEEVQSPDALAAQQKQKQKEEVITPEETKESPKKEAHLKDLPPVTGKKTGGKLEPLEESKSRLPELTTSVNLSKSSLPPIGRRNYDAFSNEELMKEKEQISKKLEGMNATTPKQQVSQESLEERKKRLQAQRELILKKKQQERDAELKKYESDQKSGIASSNLGANPLGTSDLLESNSTSTSHPIDVKEAEKRKAIYSQLKKDLA